MGSFAIQKRLTFPAVVDFSPVVDNHPKFTDMKKGNTDREIENLYPKFILLISEINLLEKISEDISYFLNVQGNAYPSELVQRPFIGRILDSFQSNYANKFCALMDTDLKAKNTLPKLIRRLLSERRNSDWEDIISKGELESCLKKIENIQSSDVFGKLVILRNKQYAHLDYEKIDSKNSLSHQEVQLMLNGVVEVVKFLNRKLFNIVFREDLTGTNNDRFIFEEISAFLEIEDFISRDAEPETDYKVEIQQIIDKYLKK
jgi:hypothetical protein